MGNSLLITGAGGFIGSQLVQKLSANGYASIYCLDVNPDKLLEVKHSQIIAAGLAEVDKYQAALSECRTVIHLAAATGKAISPETYTEVNVDGTQTLIAQCESAGVENFLYFSTIAARYPDKTYYDYAQSKARSEKIVQSSRLRYSIVRPTIVIGENGATWNSLIRLVKLPVVPLFGGGENLVQPIYVEDLVECITTILDNDQFERQIIELGGPETVPFREFLAAIGSASFGKPPRFIRLPYRSIKNSLGVLENKLRNFHLPINAGQLSAFGNDGTIAGNDLIRQNSPRMKKIQEMIELSLAGQKEALLARQLDQEARVYTKYLIHQEPDAYVLEKYCLAHQKSPELCQGTTSPFDARLVGFSAKSPTWARLADSYTAIFLRNALVRKKIILLMAILESSAPFYQAFEAPESKNPFLIFGLLGLRGSGFAISLLIASLIFLPMRFILPGHPKNEP